MTALDNHVSKRRDNHSFYKNILKDVLTVQFLEEPNHHFSNRWLSCVLLDSHKTQEELRMLFESENIETRPLWKPMHQQPIFKDCPKYINGVSDNLFEKGLCLPSGSNLTEGEQSRVSDVFRTYFG